MTEEVPEAPYIFTWDIVNIEGQDFKVFRLGKDGKEKLLNSVPMFIFNKELAKLSEKIEVLIEVIGGKDKLVEYFKDKILQSVKTAGKRESNLVTEPFWFEKHEALRQLFAEGKVANARGWIKLNKKVKRK